MEIITNSEGAAGTLVLDEGFQRLVPESAALPTPEPENPLPPESLTREGAWADPPDLPFSRSLTDEDCSHKPVRAPDDQCSLGTRK